MLSVIEIARNLYSTLLIADKDDSVRDIPQPSIIIEHGSFNRTDKEC